MKKNQDRGAPGPTAWVTSLTKVTHSSVRAYAHTCTSAQAPCCTETELYHTPPLSKKVRWQWLTLAALRRISLSCSSFLCFSILSSCSKKRSCERTSAVCSQYSSSWEADRGKVKRWTKLQVVFSCYFIDVISLKYLTATIRLDIKAEILNKIKICIIKAEENYTKTVAENLLIINGNK